MNATEVCTKGTLRHEPTFSAVHLQRADQYASVPRSSDCKQQQNNCTSVVLIGQPCEILLSFQSVLMPTSVVVRSHFQYFCCERVQSSFSISAANVGLRDGPSCETAVHNACAI